MVTSVQASALRSLFTLCIFMALVFSTVEGTNTTVGHTTRVRKTTRVGNTTAQRTITTQQKNNTEANTNKERNTNRNGNGIQCAECIGPACRSTTKTCMSSFDCFTSVQLYTSPDGTQKVIPVKGCSSDVCTSMNFSLTLGSGKRIGTEYQCCSSRNCNQRSLEMPPASTKENGVSCPACYAEEGKDCKAQSLKCTGTETVCVQADITRVMPGTLPLKTFGRGCATKSSCSASINKINSFITLQISCVKTAAGSAPPMRTISPTLTSLLLLRVLL